MALWRTFWTRGIVAVVPACVLLSSPLMAADDHPVLSLPIVCEPGKTCFIQSYVDHDPGAGVTDFACGSATYDGHKGTDFRILSAAAAAEGFAVIASADGIVKGYRDGMEDYLIPDNEHARVANRECGNGVVLDHGNGWETQYCHMKQGSVRVSNGQAIKRGDRLGDVGYSGLAEFAHVHFEIRHGSDVIDPFTGKAKNAVCENGAAPSAGFWTADAAKAFPVTAGEIIQAFFTTRIPTRDEIEVDDIALSPVAGIPVLYFVSRTTNTQKGDVVRIAMTGPGGFKYESANDPLPVNRPLHLAFGIAKTSKGSPVPTGLYTGKAELVRGGKVISARAATFEIKP